MRQPRLQRWAVVGFAIPVAALLIASVAGCSRPAPGTETAPAPNASPPTVAVVKPERKTIRLTVAQPGTVQAFEVTPIFSKIPGYVEKWNVDRGDPVEKGDVLAELYVPEMVEELKQKEALVAQAKEAYEVAKARVETAAALLQESKAGLQRATADHQRWRLENERIAKLSTSVIDPQTKVETWNQLQAAAAGQKEAEAKIESARATVKESEAARGKARADIDVAEANRRHAAALLSYAKLTAPFKGIVTGRTVNTGDFVQPATANKGEPLFVVERTDVVRIFLKVPETDAEWVAEGTAARIRLPALNDRELAGTVQRTSWSLDKTNRTLLAEIDLPNPGGKLRPGTYAYGTLTGERAGAWTLPVAAVVTQGDVTSGYQTFCYVVRDGKAYRARIEVGVRDSQRVEVLKKQTGPSRPGEEAKWEDFTGEEEVVAANPAVLKDGQEVQVSR